MVEREKDTTGGKRIKQEKKVVAKRDMNMENKSWDWVKWNGKARYMLGELK